jgi:uncharacterized phage protein (TIGR01671 family)
MREFKFRSWDKIEKVMYAPTDLFLCSDDKTWAIDKDDRYGKSHRQNAESVALMQFTGLKDKNGKEIYEGDVVEYDADFIGKPFHVDIRRFEVGFTSGTFILVDPEEGGAARGGFLGINRHTCGLTVIGNIYENPELLK